MWNEAGRALALWGALQVDLTRRSQDEAERAAGRGSARPAHPGDQILHDRQGLPGRGQHAAGVRRPRLYPRAWHGAVRPRRPHRPDLRGHQRRPGDGPRRPQVAQGRRPRRSRLFFEVARPRHRRRQGRGRPGRRRRRARARARRPPGRDHVAGAERHGRPQQCRRRRLRLSGPDGPGRLRLDVAQDGRRGQARARRRRRPTASTRPSSTSPNSTPSASSRPRARCARRSRPGPKRSCGFRKRCSKLERSSAMGPHQSFTRRR